MFHYTKVQAHERERYTAATGCAPEARHLSLVNEGVHGRVGHAAGAVQDAQAPGAGPWWQAVRRYLLVIRRGNQLVNLLPKPARTAGKQHKTQQRARQKPEHKSRAHLDRHTSSTLSPRRSGGCGDRRRGRMRRRACAGGGWWQLGTCYSALHSGIAVQVVFRMSMQAEHASCLHSPLAPTLQRHLPFDRHT